MKFDWIDIALGVVCFVVVAILMSFVAGVFAFLPGFLWTALVALVAIIIWFMLRPIVLPMFKR